MSLLYLFSCKVVCMASLVTSVQSPSAVVMVRPHHFASNPQTMSDNAFQRASKESLSESIARNAYLEITQAIKMLEAQGVAVHVFEDTTRVTPDSVFPNNWFSTHSDGTLVIYPMYAENRRREYRQDIVDVLVNRYGYSQLLDFRDGVDRSEYLEGTGSVVFDHSSKVAYAVESKRTHARMFGILCDEIGYQGVLFDAADENGDAVYHTNVLMCIGSRFVMIGMDMVAKKDQERLRRHFHQSGLTIIELTPQQVGQYCGNAIELQGKNDLLLALSTTALNSLSDFQKDLIQQTNMLLPLHVPTIESAGGSVRCTIAGIHIMC